MVDTRQLEIDQRQNRRTSNGRIHRSLLETSVQMKNRLKIVAATSFFFLAVIAIQTAQAADTSNNTPEPNLLAATQVADSTEATPATSPAAAGSANAERVVVTGGELVESRLQISLEKGTSTYTMTDQQIDTVAEGENTSFNKVLTRVPGVSGDTYGAIHFRNEDPYYRYYINGTLLPAGINGFSQDIFTRSVASLTTMVGALSAQYPEGNYGLMDIRIKTGADLDGGTATFYGGSYTTLQPSFSFGASSKGTDVYFSGSYLHDALGLENPTPHTSAIHDDTDQYRGVAYLSHQLENSGRLSLIFSGTSADYEIPNTPGQVPGFDFSQTNLAGAHMNSSKLGETQNEQTYWGIIAYQQTVDDFSFQISQVNRWSTVTFEPDIKGDLFFDGVAARVHEFILINGVQADLSYQWGDAHAVRAGIVADTQRAGANNNSFVYIIDPVTGNPLGNPIEIDDEHSKRAYDYGIYLQDQWHLSEKLTLNYGLRFEGVQAYTHDNAVCPRLNIVYQVNQDTTLHAGYARYFDPPQLLNISPETVRRFDGTTNASDQDTNDPVKVEKSHYFDVGMNREIIQGFKAGLDAYYKIAKDQIDDGQFGAANISSPYNYREASMYGAELSADYVTGPLSAFLNFSVADSWAKGIVSSQFEFDADELARINRESVRFDQQQFYTASAGVVYRWMNFVFHLDALYGDGIRAGFLNKSKLQSYYPVNLGLEQHFKLHSGGDLAIRFDVTNLFDQVYVLNDGTGIGEGAVKYGHRRALYGGISYSF
jgi:outer membrane receptor protein involved in Fe transport